MSDYNFIIDIQSRRLVADYFSTEAGTPPSIVFGDQPTVNVQLVEANNDSADYPWKSVALTGQSIRVGVGSLEDATPSAYIELTADLAAASSVITEIRTGVLNTTNEIQRVQILDAVKGNYTLTIAGETTTPLCLDASLEEITDAVEALASITADSVEVTGNPTDYRVEFDSSLADVGAITVNLDNITSRVGKTGTLDLHVTEILTLLDDETTVEATLEVVQWTTADVAGETVLQVPVTITQDVIPDTVPSTTPLPGYATIDLDHINQSGAATGQVPSWNGTEWVPITAAGTGDMLASVYDPTPVNGDAFDMDNMVEGTNLILTAAERTKLGDQVLTDVIDKLAWNATDLTFDIDTGAGVVIQIGQELLVKARNVTGVTISNGAVVRINGASGSRPTIVLAQADSIANLSSVIGIVTADILNNAVGFVTVHGLVRDLNTSAFTEGDDLYLSDSVAGGLTNVEPTLSVPVGTVTFANAGGGTIFASVENQKHLLEFASDPTLAGNFSAASWKTGLAVAATDLTATGTPSATTYLRGDNTWATVAGGGASQLSDLSDVNTSTPTSGFALIADGVDFESRAIAAADVSDFDTEVDNNAAVALNTAKVTNVSTNLSYTAAPTIGTVTSSDGTDATLPLADVTNAGLLSPSDFSEIAANTAASHAAATKSGTGTYVTLSAQDIVVDPIDPADLSATGTPSVSTYLRGDNTWATVSGSGDVVKVGTPVDNEIGVWTGDGTLEGDTNFTWDGSILDVTGEAYISKTATQADEHGIEINYNAAGFGDAKALDIVYTTGAITTGSDEAAILINVDETAATGGSIFGLEVLTTDGAADKVCGMKVGAIVAPVCQESGTFANPTTGTNNTASTNVPAMYDGSTGTNTTLFVADNDYIIIGAAAAFTEIEFILQTLVANPGIAPTFAYSTAGAGVFTTFSPTDGTNGFTNNGVVAWSAGDLTGHAINSDTGTFDIKITRTSNTKGNASLYYAKTAATTSYQWDESGVVTVASAVVDDEVYGAGWNASLEVPTKNAIYDKIEGLPCEIGIACGDETTVPAASTSVAAVTFTMPYAMTLTEVMASAVVAPTTTTVIVDIHDGATTIMGTNKLDILTTAFVDDNTATLSDTALAKDAIITVYVDQTDVAVAGLKIWLIGTRT